MYAVLEAEAIVICVSCLVHVWNVPPLLYQMFMIGYRVQVIYPYGSIYLSVTSGPNGAVLLALSFVTCFTILLEGEGEPSCPFH